MNDYRTMLKEELEKRCSVNSRYSLRAFARDLKISPSRLSEVLNGNYGLSRSAAEAIARRLGLTDDEIDFFADLVESEHGRSKTKRELARIRLERSRAFSKSNQLQLDAFAVISDWYHFAILELTYLDDFKSDIKWIANALGIAASQVTIAIERLKRLELISERDGSFVANDDTTFSPDGVPSESIKKFHKQVLERAIGAIDLQSLDERNFNTYTLAINSERIPEAKKMINNFLIDFVNHFGVVKEKKDQVYCMSTQFFRFTNNR